MQSYQGKLLDGVLVGISISIVVVLAGIVIIVVITVLVVGVALVVTRLLLHLLSSFLGRAPLGNYSLLGWSVIGVPLIVGFVSTLSLSAATRSGSGSSLSASTSLGRCNGSGRTIAVLKIDDLSVD